MVSDESIGGIFQSAFGHIAGPGERFVAPAVTWPECPPVGTVLAANWGSGERPTVFVVGREDADGRYLDETGGTINQPWRVVLKRRGVLTVIGRISLIELDKSDDARDEA